MDEGTGNYARYNRVSTVGFFFLIVSVIVFVPSFCWAFYSGIDTGFKLGDFWLPILSGTVTVISSIVVALIIFGVTDDS